jgi:hypothetical protein
VSWGYILLETALKIMFISTPKYMLYLWYQVGFIVIRKLEAKKKKIHIK